MMVVGHTSELIQTKLWITALFTVSLLQMLQLNCLFFQFSGNSILNGSNLFVFLIFEYDEFFLTLSIDINMIIRHADNYWT